MRLEFPGNLPGDLSLDLKHVLGCQCPLIALGPHLPIRSGVDQPCVDLNLIGGFLDLAIEDPRDPKLLRDRGKRLVRLLIPHHGDAGCHAEPRNVRQASQKVAVDTLRERVGLFATKGLEREHGDRAV